MSTTTTEKKLTDKEILQQVIDAVHMSKNKFGLAIGYATPTEIYHVMREDNDPLKRPISDSLILKIVKKFPNVSYTFLKTGEGPILKEEGSLQAQLNIMHSTEEKYSLREHLNRVEQKLDEILSRL